METLLALLLAAFCLLSVTACGGSDDGDEENTAISAAPVCASQSAGTYVCTYDNPPPAKIP